MNKIVFTVTNDLTYDRRMHRICNSLQAAGYAVKLVGRSRKNSQALAQQSYSQKRIACFFNRGFLFYAEFNVRLFFYLLKEKYDVVCGIDLDTILACYFAGVLRGKTTVYDAHELFSEVPEVIDRPIVRRIWLKIEQFAFMRVENCYTVSESVSNIFYQRYGRKPVVIRNLPLTNIDNQENLRADPQVLDFIRSRKTIIYRGAVNEGRGLEELILALQQLPNLNLLILGDGDLMEEVRMLIRKMMIDHRILCAGYTAPELLDIYTTISWLGVNLLDDHSDNYKYSLANKFLDYIQCGIPQVSMNFPEYNSINSRYEIAVLIDNLSVPKLVEAITTLYNDGSLYEQLQANCIVASRDLTWEREESRLINFYRTLD